MKTEKRTVISIGRILVLFLFVGGILASCSDDDGDNAINRDDFGRNYFDIQDGDFEGRALPGSNSSDLEIYNISGNSTILAGGSNQINIVAGENAREVIVGVQDREGYFSVPMVADRSNASRGAMDGGMTADLQLLIGQQASEDFTIAFAVGDGAGNFSDYQFLPVNIMDAGTGLLQVSLQWNQENDVDLHLIEPSGAHIYYGNRSSQNGGQLDVDSNAGCSIDNINNENIYYEDDPNVTIEYGEYEVLVDLWSNCSIDEDTQYSIVVHYGDALIATTEGVNPHSGVLTPDQESHNSNLISVMKFNIVDAPANRNMSDRNLSTTPKFVKFNHDPNNKVFQAFGSKKE